MLRILSYMFFVLGDIYSHHVLEKKLVLRYKIVSHEVQVDGIVKYQCS